MVKKLTAEEVKAMGSEVFVEEITLSGKRMRRMRQIWKSALRFVLAYVVCLGQE